MFVDENEETVLANVFVYGHYKMMLFLESMMSRKEFVGYALLPDNSDTTPIGYAIKKAQSAVVKYLLDMKEIQAEYTDNDSMFFRLFFWLFCYNSDDNLTKYVLSVL